MRLIDADERIAFMVETVEDKDLLLNQYNADWICSFIEEAPTVDAVEVVRCCECKWYCIDEHQCDHQICMVVFDDDFCSYGKRKGELK